MPAGSRRSQRWRGFAGLKCRACRFARIRVPHFEIRIWHLPFEVFAVGFVAGGEEGAGLVAGFVGVGEGAGGLGKGDEAVGVVLDERHAASERECLPVIVGEARGVTHGLP